LEKIRAKMITRNNIAGSWNLMRKLFNDLIRFHLYWEIINANKSIYKTKNGYFKKGMAVLKINRNKVAFSQ
jgi:hypothetical protein